MMTLKQAFTVAAVQQTAKAPAQLCEACPLQGLHKLCERIEGEWGAISCNTVRAEGTRKLVEVEAFVAGFRLTEDPMRCRGHRP